MGNGCYVTLHCSTTVFMSVWINLQVELVVQSFITLLSVAAMPRRLSQVLDSFSNVTRANLVHSFFLCVVPWLGKLSIACAALAFAIGGAGLSQPGNCQLMPEWRFQ